MYNDVVKQFESVTAFHNYLANGRTQPDFYQRASSHSETSNKKRDTKTSTYQEADNLLLYGDKKLQKKIENAGVEKMRLKLRQRPCGRRFYSAVVGVAPNVGNAIAGIPTAMINVQVRKRPQKVLNICYTCSADGSVSANDIIATSAQLISALMIIEASGVRVNLYLGEVSCAHSPEGKQLAAFLIRIKSASQPFDVLKMSYPLAHPSMLRRHLFHAMEVTEGLCSDFSFGYGYCVDVKKQADLFKTTRINIDVCADFYSCRNKTANDIVEMLTKGGKD